MKTIIIYLDKDKKNKMVIRPSSSFDGNILDLVLHLTKSNLESRSYIKNYHSFETLD